MRSGDCSGGSDRLRTIAPRGNKLSVGGRHSLTIVNRAYFFMHLPTQHRLPMLGCAKPEREPGGVSSRISAVTGLLPPCFCTRESNRQYMWKPARCQRTTVSGETITSTVFHENQKRGRTSQNSWLVPVSLGRSLEHYELLTEGEIFKQQALARAKQPNKGAHPKLQKAEHGSNC